MKAVRLLTLLALLAALLLLIAGPGARLALWEYGFGFTLMRWALYLGAASAALALIALAIPRLRRGQVGALSLAIVLGLATVALPLSQVQKARSVPHIHDITTDTIDPPAFVAIAPLRSDAPNPVGYAGKDVAAQQREGYPDLGPLRVDRAPADVFASALDAAEAMGWEMVAAEPTDRRIEATDTTFWFGFKDDVVIRVRTQGEGSVVDVRSKSRVGGSDIGANAARIERYLAELSERLER